MSVSSSTQSDAPDRPAALAAFSSLLMRLSSFVANPLFLRVVHTAGKRQRDLLIRSFYLGLLVVIVLVTLLNLGGTSLDQLAGASARMFEQMSYLQLGLIALLAPIFTAGAITQEKDAQTYDVLLATPLTNTQIVLGSLFSRLFFVLALLISGIPIFAITLIFGGVAVHSIVMSFLIAAATACVAGSLALAVATFRLGNRRPIFGFYLSMVIYLLGLWLLDSLSFFHIALLDGSISNTSWLTGLNPFLALRVIFNNPSAAAPNLAQLPQSLRAWPLNWYWTSPASFYIVLMFLISGVMVIPSTLLLRRVAQSTWNWRTWLLVKLHLSQGHTTRRPRPVWNNPIAWRQARTKSSSARGGAMRYVLMAAALGCAIAILALYGRIRTPERYVIPSSWDPAHNTLTIIQRGQSVPYVVDPRAPVTINGQRAALDQIDGELAVQRSAITRDHVFSINLVDAPRALSQQQTRKLLLILVCIELAALLLIVTNSAASTVTREKEDGSLDLLLATPMTSRYYIWGKLRGLVVFALPMIAVPVVSILLFVVYDFFNGAATSGTATWTAFPEALLALPAVFIMAAALAAMLGMHMSLICRKTVTAVMSSAAIVAGACGILAWIGWAIASNAGADAANIAVALASFSPFTLAMMLIDPYSAGVIAFDSANFTASDMLTSRLIILMFALVASVTYAGIVWTMYRSMVKNFDMTIRRQAR